MEIKFGAQVRKAMNCEQCYEHNGGCLYFDESCRKNSSSTLLLTECLRLATQNGYGIVLGGKNLIARHALDGELHFQYVTSAIYWFSLYNHFKEVEGVDRLEKGGKNWQLCWKCTDILDGYFEGEGTSVIPCSLPELDDALIEKAMVIFK